MWGLTVLVTPISELGYTIKNEADGDNQPNEKPSEGAHNQGYDRLCLGKSLVRKSLSYERKYYSDSSNIPVSLEVAWSHSS